MQSHDEQKKQPPDLAQNPEISEAWRALLGLQSSSPETENGQQAAPTPPDAQQVDPLAEMQPQSGDPWNTLLHAKGMETVDLQKVRLRERHPAASDEDVEQALNIIQEANAQAPQEKKPGEA